MAYTVLARRYRSRTFDEVVGQEAIARTLRNAIEQGRVAHAYLFVGTRGVGKTTMARLFAKALNAPGDEPAAIAEAIMHGRDTDVVEIDAASHGSVDEARELIANAVYRPMHGAFKIYIIDEVHMLSTAAFNALLKTMEEPPEHVKFVLCTTEAHKVPATIQSRCQRFDFRNIPTAMIAEHVRSVVEREAMTAEPELVQAVARMGAGSMRDALSLLDRLMAAGEGGQTLTLGLLEELLGLPPRDLVVRLLGAIADADASGALATTDELLSRGISIDQMLDSLAEALRDLMVLSACGEGTDLVDLSGPAREQAVDLSRRFDTAVLVHMIAVCEAGSRTTRMSSTPRALLDALVARLAMADRMADAVALAAGAPAPARAQSPVASTARSRAPAKKV